MSAPIPTTTSFCGCTLNASGEFREQVRLHDDRIEELFGIDTEDADARFDLLLAYRIRTAIVMQNAQQDASH